MVSSFKYQELQNAKGLKNKPCLNVTLEGRSKFPFKVAMLLDSGADVSAIPLDLAEVLNLDLNVKENHTNGVGGSVRSKTTTMKMSVYLKEDHRTYSYVIPVDVILENYDNLPPILGRKGFFDKFQITFIEAEEKIKIKKYKKIITH